MAVQPGRVTVGTEATRLDAAVEADYAVGSAAFGRTFGQSVTTWNRSASVSVFLGGPGVTAVTGFELVAGADFSCDLAATDQMWGITASGTALCHVLQVGV